MKSIYRRIRQRNHRIALKHRRLLYSPKEKLHNCIWIFILGDPDDKPSVPHAHSQESGYRVNAWNGDIYPAGNDRKTIIGKLTVKELSKLHGDKQFIKFACKQIEWYQRAHPQINIAIPGWFKQVYMSRIYNPVPREDDLEVYVFCGEAILQSDLQR